MPTAFIDFDTALLAKLSDTMKNRICEKTFVNLQRRVNHELEEVNKQVQSMLTEDARIRDFLDTLEREKWVNNHRKHDNQNTRWNTLHYQPNLERIHSFSSETHKNKRVEMQQLFEAYLSHLNRVGTVYLDGNAADNYDPYSVQYDPPWTLKQRTKSTSAKTLPDLSQNDLEKTKLTRWESTRRPTSWKHLPTSNRSHNSTRWRVRNSLSKNVLPCRTGFDLQWRPSPRPLSWRRVSITNIESEERAMSRKRMNGAFNRSMLPIIPVP